MDSSFPCHIFDWWQRQREESKSPDQSRQSLRYSRRCEAWRSCKLRCMNHFAAGYEQKMPVNDTFRAHKQTDRQRRTDMIVMSDPSSSRVRDWTAPSAPDGMSWGDERLLWRRTGCKIEALASHSPTLLSFVCVSHCLHHHHDGDGSGLLHSLTCTRVYVCIAGRCNGQQKQIQRYIISIGHYKCFYAQKVH